MPKIQLTKKDRKISGPKLILIWIVFLIIFLMMLSSVFNLFIKYKKIKSHIKELKQEELILKEKKEKLIDSNNYIETPEGQEQIFREKYRVVKPGEGLIIITKDEKPIIDTKKPILKRFWDSIKQGLGIN